MPGPLPKPNARRRRTPGSDAHKTLPAEFDGPIPPFPLGKLDRRRAAAWRELWRRPQAAAWTELNLVDQVARFFALRNLIDDTLAAGGEPKAATLSELRALESTLALTPIALARLRWKIADPADVVDLRPAHAPVRQRVRAVDPPTKESER